MTDTLNGSGTVTSNGTGISCSDYKDTFITPASNEFYLRQTHLSSGRYYNKLSIKKWR